MAVYSVLIKEVLWVADQQILVTCWSGCEDRTFIPRGGQQGIGSEGRQIQRTGPFRNSLGDRQTSQEQDTKITASDQKSGDLCNNGFGDGKRSWGCTVKAALQRAGGGCTLSTLFTLAELTHWHSSAGSHWALLEAAIPPPPKWLQWMPVRLFTRSQGIPFIREPLGEKFSLTSIPRIAAFLLHSLSYSLDSVEWQKWILLPSSISH